MVNVATRGGWKKGWHGYGLAYSSMRQIRQRIYTTTHTLQFPISNLLLPNIIAFGHCILSSFSIPPTISATITDAAIYILYGQREWQPSSYWFKSHHNLFNPCNRPFYVTTFTLMETVNIPHIYINNY